MPNLSDIRFSAFVKHFITTIWWIPYYGIEAAVCFALGSVVEDFGEFEFPVKEVFGSGELFGGLDDLLVIGVEGSDIVVFGVEDGTGFVTGGVLSAFVGEVFADPDVEQAFEGGEGVVGSAIGGTGFGDLGGGDVGEGTDTAHEFGGVEEVAELAAPEGATEGVLHIFDVAADEGVASFHVVVEEGKGRTEGETVEPEADFGQFDGHGVEVYAVDAAFQDLAFEQVDVGELAYVYGDFLLLHLLLDGTAGLG